MWKEADFISLLDSPSSPSQDTCSLFFLRGKISFIYPNGLLMGLVSQGCASHQQDVGVGRLQPVAVTQCVWGAGTLAPAEHFTSSAFTRFSFSSLFLRLCSINLLHGTSFPMPRCVMCLAALCVCFLFLAEGDSREGIGGN